MSDSDIIEFLRINMDYFTPNDFISSAFHCIEWGLLKFLKTLSDAGQSLYDYTFGLVDITSWSNLNDFINRFEPVINSILIFTIVILGILFITGKHKNYTFLYSVLIFVFVFTSSNYIFTQLNTFSVLFKNAVVDEQGTSEADAIISNNLVDLVYVDSKIGLENMNPDNVPHPDLSSQQIKYININEVINYDTSKIASDDAKNILKKRLLFYYPDNFELNPISNGWGWNSQDSTDLGNEFYYRYSVKYSNAVLDMIVLILIFFCLSYKNVKIIYELVVSRILAYLFSADMTSNQKIVKILIGIRDLYFALCFTCITLKSFMIFRSYLTNNTSIQGLQRSIILLFVAWCVIDGADVMEKITGVDAGLKGGAAKIIAAYHLARGAVNTAGGFASFIRQGAMNKSMRNQADALQQLSGGNNSTKDEQFSNMSNANNKEGGNVNSNAESSNNNKADQNVNSKDASKQNMNNTANQNDINSGFAGNENMNINNTENGMNNMSDTSGSESLDNLNVKDSGMSGNSTESPYKAATDRMNQMDNTLSSNNLKNEQSTSGISNMNMPGEASDMMQRFSENNNKTGSAEMNNFKSDSTSRTVPSTSTINSQRSNMTNTKSTTQSTSTINKSNDKKATIKKDNSKPMSDKTDLKR